MHYLEPRGVNKSDHAAKVRAWMNWSRKLEGIEAAERRQLQCRASQQSQMAVDSRREAGLCVAKATDYGALAFDPPTVSRAARPDASLAELLTTYLSKKRLDAECGERSIQTYREHLDKLDDFSGFIRDRTEHTRASEITAIDLDCYRSIQKHLQSTGEISAATVRKRLLCLKQFLEWCYEIEAIEHLPRNVNRKFTRVDMPEAEPKRFTSDEIRALWREAPNQPFSGSSRRLRLCIALALNCGYNPTCIASLEHGHINWETGMIDRPRHKTRGRQVHKLWPITLELLRREATKPDSSNPGSAWPK